MGTSTSPEYSGVESFEPPSDTGATTVEYILLVALVIAGLVVAATDLRGDIVALVNGLTT
ncbi:hypothetical protein AB0F72_40430 [Actinoplanes sp. NPDC023936]|uniref:Flp family type IVb pilin n=1 Tax=Actinoplanes sp. NPDC023936 TaxID=3154910 RepID=UPI0033C82A48